MDSVVFELKKLDTLQNEFILFGLSLENTGPAEFTSQVWEPTEHRAQPFSGAMILKNNWEIFDADSGDYVAGVNDT